MEDERGLDRYKEKVKPGLDEQRLGARRSPGDEGEVAGLEVEMLRNTRREGLMEKAGPGSGGGT